MGVLSYYTEDKLTELVDDEIFERINSDGSTDIYEKVESARDVIWDMVDYIKSIGDDIIEDKIKTPED